MELQTAATTELVVLLQDSGLDDSKTTILRSRFADYFTIAQQWKTEALSLVVTSEDQTELIKRARQGRLVLKDKRVAIERTRKELKDDSLKEGRAIDAVAKLLTSLIEPTEKFLLEQEEFAKRAQEQRAEALRVQVEARRWGLAQYGGEADEQFLEEATAREFNEVLDTWIERHTKAQHLKEQEAQAQRQADQRNRDELLKENQRLQEEARQRDEQLVRERQQQQAQLQKERDEAQALRDAEAKRKRDQKEQHRQTQLQAATLAAGPDKTKLVALADRIYQLNLSVTGEQLQGEKARTIVASVDTTLDKIQNWLREQAETL